MRENIVDFEETRGKDDIRIPNPDIFDNSLRNDCEKVFHWLDRFYNINTENTSKVEVYSGCSGNSQIMDRLEEILTSDALYIRGRNENEWLILTKSSQGDNIEHEYYGTKHTIGPKLAISISLLTAGQRAPIYLMVSSWQEESITGTSAWIREPLPNGECIILSEKDGTMIEINDKILQTYDFYEGNAPAHTPEIQTDIDLAKQESDYLREKFDNFISYIS